METDINKNEEPRQSTPQHKKVLSSEYSHCDENGNICPGVRIHAEFEKLIHPLTHEEQRVLEKDILDKSCLDPIKVWKGYIVDGHHRHRICEENNILFEVLDLDFDDEWSVKRWMISNQLGRRNLTDAARIEYASMQVDIIRGIAQRNQEESRFQKGNDLSKLDSKTRKFFERKSNKQKVLVSAAIGRVAGVSPRTVAKYSYVKKRADAEDLKNLKEGNLVPFGNKGKKKKLSVDCLYRELKRKERKHHVDKEELEKEIKKVSIENAKLHSPEPSEVKTDCPAVERKDLYNQPISSRIITHPIADLSKHVKPDSIDLIITEPPCKEEDIDLFDQLGEFARHALKEGSPCIVISGNRFLPDFIEMLRAHLDYCWTLSFNSAGGVYEALGANIETRWKPILVFSKGEPNLKAFSDCSDSFESIVESFSYIGETICDPFCGSGSIGKTCLEKKRGFIGSDIDVEKTLALKV